MKGSLVLGTANFGLQYGIANNRMLSEREAFTVLEKALDLGVRGVDTAAGYGEAERVIGRFFKRAGKVFDVVTKLPDMEYAVAGDAETQIEMSIDRLGVERIDTLMLHNFRTFERYSGVLLPVLERYVSEGLVGRYGLSVYHRHELETAIGRTREAGLPLGAAQFPLNLFDRRFLKGAYPEELRASGITLYGRSVFLQGLFFMEEASLGERLREAGPKIERLRGLARMHATSVEALALCFAASSGVDYLVVGVDNPAQLERNAALLADGMEGFYLRLNDGLDSLEITDEEIILPYRWKQ